MTALHARMRELCTVELVFMDNDDMQSTIAYPGLARKSTSRKEDALMPCTLMPVDSLVVSVHLDDNGTSYMSYRLQAKLSTWVLKPEYSIASAFVKDTTVHGLLYLRSGRFVLGLFDITRLGGSNLWSDPGLVRTKTLHDILHSSGNAKMLADAITYHWVGHETVCLQAYNNPASLPFESVCMLRLPESPEQLCGHILRGIDTSRST